MKLSDILAFLTAHAFGAAAYLTLFFVVPVMVTAVIVIALFIVGMFTGDRGGPLFLPALLVTGLIYAVAIGLIGFGFFLITGGIQLLRRRIKIPFWIPVLLIFPAIYSILPRAYSGSMIVSIILSLAFCTYWTAFSGADSILNWCMGKRRNRRLLHI